ncbi:unnamed protein product [Diamesa serratosioi]
MSGEKGGSKVKTFMGTPKAFKMKFFSVLGNSTSDIISGISNKIDAALSLASSSETTTADNINEAKVRNKLKEQHERAKCTEYSLDDHIIDFELRRVKERRAHEEILSGRYRHPAFISQSTVSVECPNVVVPTKVPSIDFVVVVDRSTKSHVINNSPIDKNASTLTHNCTTKSPKILTTKENNLLGLPTTSNASTGETSESDNLSICEGSLESLDVKMWHKSDPSDSVPVSYASSLSLDCQTDEVAIEFMRRFVSILFTDSVSITLELKSQFGQYSRMEAGRMWFARFINAQRAKVKRVDETTFYALIQYFAIVLFECTDSEDYSPAKCLMSLSFAFYHEVDVPGCDPYREYLYVYLRDQPIWHNLRFWNAAFFYALTKDKSSKTKFEHSRRRSSSSVAVKSVDDESNKNALKCRDGNQSRSVSESSLSSSNSSENAKSTDLELLGKLKKCNRAKSSSMIARGDSLDIDEKKIQQNYSFSQLGSLTSSLHAFGVSKDLCCEFLKKQCQVVHLTKEQEKMLYENMYRLYRETDPWRTE